MPQSEIEERLAQIEAVANHGPFQPTWESITKLFRIPDWYRDAKFRVFDIECGQSADIRPDFWQIDTSVSKNSWGYVKNQNYKNAGDIVDDLVDIISKNGMLLLNIGAKPDGTIPEHEQRMLRDIGAWLKVNGEAIYSTQPWKIFGEGPTKIVAGSSADVKRAPIAGADIRFTTKGYTLYAIALAWPNDGRFVVESLGTNAGLLQGEIKKVALLGVSETPEWEQTDEGLQVKLPDRPFLLNGQINQYRTPPKLQGVVVKATVQNFLNEIVSELAKGNRLEFRDFGFFELRDYAPRKAQNPKTLERVHVPSKRAVKFKMGRLMKQKLNDKNM